MSDRFFYRIIIENVFLVNESFDRLLFILLTRLLFLLKQLFLFGFINSYLIFFLVLIRFI